MKTRMMLILMAFSCTPAYADRKAADACAAGLPAASKQIYDQAVDKVQPGADNKAVVKQITQDMVGAGQLSMLSAKSSAQAAGGCLKKLAE